VTARYSDAALRAIDRILDHIKRKSPAGANSVLLALEEAVAFCSAFPFGCPATNKPNIRRCMVVRATSAKLRHSAEILDARRVKNARDFDVA
jgi:plasmid stabilization system protein ParE